MAKFRFKYEAVLAQRQRAEDAARRELAQWLGREQALRDRLASMQADIRGSKRELGDALVGRVDLDRVADFARYSNHTTVHAQQLVSQLAALHKDVEAARQRLMHASQQRKAMELLRDRHYAAWLADQQRREQREMDELATQRHARRESEALS